MAESILENLPSGVGSHYDFLLGEYVDPDVARERLRVHTSEGGWREWSQGVETRGSTRFTITLFRATQHRQSRSTEAIALVPSFNTAETEEVIQ